MPRIAAALAAFALAATAAFHATAQTPPSPACPPEHAKMGHCVAPAPAGDSASTKAFKAANDKMHAGMSIPYTGNADVDFVRGMIPHHQGAVEMAKIVLAHGKDPALKKLAREIIAAQDKEIAFMQRWLAKNAKH